MVPFNACQYFSFSIDYCAVHTTRVSLQTKQVPVMLTAREFCIYASRRNREPTNAGIFD